MRHVRGLAIHCIAVLGLVSLLGCSTGSIDTGDTAAQNDCPADSTWFPHSRTPTPPAETFAGNNQCDFHQWSWQAFLWLTQEDAATGGPRFLSFMTPEELFTGTAGAALNPRMGKSATPETLDEFLQAGTDGIMTDQTGRPIYYSQYIDPTFAAFVTDNGLTDPRTLAALDDTVTFPNGAMELKVSWKLVQPEEDASRFFTMQSDVYALANRRGTIVIDQSRTESVTLALVGFHIAGRVAGHPEMIWATFEHADDAPNIFTYENIGSPIAMDSPVSNRDYTFYAANTPRSECNVNTASSPVRELEEATQTITPITQVCRRYEFGNQPAELNDSSSSIDSLSVQNDGNVASLNGHVLDNLAADDVWSNYREVGAVWFDQQNALAPDNPLDGLCVEGTLTATGCVVAGRDEPGARLIGSLLLSNATIETFTQSQSTMNSCFRCHNTNQRLYLGDAPGGLPALPGKNLNISHIIVNGYFRNQER